MGRWDLYTFQLAFCHQPSSFTWTLSVKHFLTQSTPFFFFSLSQSQFTQFTSAFLVNGPNQFPSLELSLRIYPTRAELHSCSLSLQNFRSQAQDVSNAVGKIWPTKLDFYSIFGGRIIIKLDGGLGIVCLLYLIPNSWIWFLPYLCYHLGTAIGMRAEGRGIERRVVDGDMRKKVKVEDEAHQSPCFRNE